MKNRIYFLLTLFFLILSGCQREQINQLEIADAKHSDSIEDDHDQILDMIMVEQKGCAKPSQAQINQVNLGLKKLNQFLEKCYLETNSKKWCDQVARPNPDSYSTFSCTYSATQPHYFVHPDESNWKFAIQAVKLVQDLEKSKVKIDIIYNWWRPEPYNVNVGGAAGRHPLGTSVDVRFINKAEQNKAHKLLCAHRKQGRLRALGYYPGTGLHLGVGDKTANTWGKECI